LNFIVGRTPKHGQKPKSFSLAKQEKKLAGQGREIYNILTSQSMFQ